MCRTESSGPFTGCNILTVFSQVVLEDVQHNNTTRVTELSSSTTEWGVSSTVKNNGFLVPWRLFPLSPIATGATFQGRETLKKNTRKVEEWEGKLVLTVHSSWTADADTVAVLMEEQVGTVGLGYCWASHIQELPRQEPEFLWDSHIVSHCVLKTALDSLQHLVGRGSEQRQCCKTGIPRAYLCPQCDIFRLTWQQQKC